MTAVWAKFIRCMSMCFKMYQTQQRGWAVKARLWSVHVLFTCCLAAGQRSITNVNNRELSTAS